MQIKHLIFILIFLMSPCFGNHSVEVLSERNFSDEKKKELVGVRLEYPDIKTITELLCSFEDKAIRTQRTKKAVITLGIATALAVAGKYGYDIWFADSNINANKISDDSASVSSSKKKEANEPKIKEAKDRYWYAKVEKMQNKRNASYWFKRGVNNGVYFGFTSALVGVILGIMSSTSSFSNEQIFLFLEAGSLKNTFLTLKDGLAHNLNWTAELLKDLSSSRLSVADNFTSYSGLIDSNFAWVHAVENFLAIILAKTKMKFGENSPQYKNVIEDEKILLSQIKDFIKSMESDINLWNILGYCDVSDKTFEFLRIMMSHFLTFSNSVQFMLYDSLVKLR